MADFSSLLLTLVRGLLSLNEVPLKVVGPDIPLTESLFEVLLCGAQNISGMMSLEGTLSEPGFIFPYATTFCLSLLGCNALVLMP